MTAHGWRRKRTDTAAEKARRKKYASPAHRAARTRYAADVDAGIAVCWRCTRPIPRGTPSTAWHVGHDDADVDLIRGPEHRRCNLEAAAIKGNAARRGPPGVTRLTW